MTINKKIYLGLLSAIFSILVTPGFALAASAPQVDTGDTAFILICSALVLIMTPGLALFYGGMVQKKNVLSVLMQCLFIMALVSVQWVLAGYSMAFGPDHAGLIGGLDWLGLHGVGIEPFEAYSATIPHQAFAAFQLMFAIITVGLIIGAFAERMRFSAFVLFVTLWVTLVYSPVAHWVWGVGGWLRELGALDFAGGTVVHISSGVSGLVAAIVIGRRVGSSRGTIPHNLPMTVTGAALLWFGWFGFNAGSALGANGLAASAFLVTNTAAAAAIMSWMLAEWLDHGKPTTLGAASGAIAGLVAITPAAGFVGPGAAIIIGLLVSPICYFAVSRLKVKLGYDDALDAFGIHGIGGTFGCLATGVFAANGLISGNPHQLLVQFISVIAVYAFASIMTFIILKAIGLMVPLRVSEEDEEAGLDLAEHGEDAYIDMGLTGIDTTAFSVG
ncbi:MAG: ammonium transporter [Methylocystaceae bacterium]